MVKINPLNTNEYSYQSGNAQSNEQKTNSIFDRYDKNPNGKVDEGDFDNNGLLTFLIRGSGWLNKDWNEVGESVLAFLKDINADNLNNFDDYYIDTKLHDGIAKMTKECDISNGANLVKVLNMVMLVDILFIRLAQEEKREDPGYYRNEFFQNIFKDNYDGCKQYRDGGSLEFNLKDGTKVFRPAGNKPNADGVIIKHPDGKIEVFDKDGKVQEPSSVSELCKEYKL